MQEIYFSIFNNPIAYVLGGIIIGFFLGWNARK
jgi:hypothetical protein